MPLCSGVSTAWAVSWLLPLGIIVLFAVYCRCCRNRLPCSCFGCCKPEYKSHNAYAAPLLGHVSQAGQARDPYATASTQCVGCQRFCVPEAALFPLVIGCFGATLLVMTLSGYEEILINQIFTWGGFDPTVYLVFGLIFVVGLPIGAVFLLVRPCLRLFLDRKNAALAKAAVLRQQKQQQAQQEAAQRQQEQQRQQQLLDEYVQKAITLLETADFQEARQHIDTGLQSFPDAPRLMQCQRTLDSNAPALPVLMDESKQLLDAGKVQICFTLPTHAFANPRPDRFSGDSYLSTTCKREWI